MKRLEKSSLYVNGTVIKNKLLAEVKTNKTKKIKDMERGDLLPHYHEYDYTKKKIWTVMLEG